MGLISQDTINKILDRSDIVEIVSNYVPLKKAGRNFKALSPFTNEKTPSFIVSPEKQIFHCFSTGIGGNAISFIMKQERMEFPEAVQFLAEKCGVPIEETAGGDPKERDLRRAIFRANELAANFFHHQLMTDRGSSAQKARDYLKKRGVDLEIVKQFKLGFAPDQWDGLIRHLSTHKIDERLAVQAGLIIPREKRDGYYDRFRNRITFPIFDHKGQCVAFGARTLTDESAKYINSPETPVYVKGEHLYGFHLSKDSVAKEDLVIVVEGYMDFIMPYQAGAKNMVASLGTALTPDQIRVVRRFTNNVVMLYDTDKAGQRAVMRSLDLLIEEGMSARIATLEKGEDPDSFIRKFGFEAFKKRILEAKSLFDYKLTMLREEFGDKSVEDRNRIVQEMLPTINRFESEVSKSEYLKQLAGALFVSQDALLKEFRKTGVKTSRVPDPKVDKQEDKRQERVAELNILKLIFEDSEFVSLTKDELIADDFQDDIIRKIIAKVYEIYDSGAEVNPAGLMNCFSDGVTQEIISGMLLEHSELSGDLRKMHKDCVGWIKTSRVKQKRQELLYKIRQAEQVGNADELENLKSQFNELVKK